MFYFFPEPLGPKIILLIGNFDAILEMYSMAADEPFSFQTVKLTAKNKDDIFMIRFDKKLKFN